MTPDSFQNSSWSEIRYSSLITSSCYSFPNFNTKNRNRLRTITWQRNLLSSYLWVIFLVAILKNNLFTYKCSCHWKQRLLNILSKPEWSFFDKICQTTDNMITRKLTVEKIHFTSPSYKHYMNPFKWFKTFHKNVGKYYVVNVVLPSEKLVNADTK